MKHTDLCTFLEGTFAIVADGLGLCLSLHLKSGKIAEELISAVCKNRK
jgi:hypothetical protein